MSKKTNNKYVSLRFGSTGKMWEYEFIQLIPHKKRKTELKNYAKLIDWEKINSFALEQIKIVMGKIDIPDKEEPVRLNTAIVEAILLVNIKRRLHPLILYHLVIINKSDTNTIKKRKINTLLSRIESEIKYSRAIYEMIIDFSSLKWIKNSKMLEKKIDKIKIEYKDKIPKFPGQRYKKEKLEVYEYILKENDLFIAKGGDGDYAEATRITVKKYHRDFKKTYRSFIRFKNKEQVFTHKDFENFNLLYYSR
jgi:hypothetical protein